MSEPLHVCEVCSAKVSELRRGRCWGCYAKWVDARPVGAGAKCIACNEKRRRVLRSVELLGHWRPMCFNCAGQLMTLSSIPDTIAGVRQALSRERRRLDRRHGKPDTRVFKYERRVGERRSSREVLMPIDDDMIIEIVVEQDDGMEFQDLTTIRELVTHLRPVDLT